MKKILFIILLVQINSATAYELQPSFPRAGQNVSIDLSFNCPYYPAATPDGETHYYEILDGNIIQLTVVIEFPGGCPGVTFPTGRVLYSLGNLPEGDYSLVINYITQDEFFPPQNPQPYLSNLSGFQVLGAAPSVPTLSLYSLLFLVLMCLFLSLGFINKSNKKTKPKVENFNP